MIYGCRFNLAQRPLLCGATGAALPYPAADVDLRGACVVDNQLGQRCVGDMVEGGRWIAVKGAGKRGSPRFVWIGARVRERLRRTDPIADTGVNPADAVDGCLAMGISPRDALDDDPGAMTSTATWAEIEGARLFEPSAFLWITPGDTETVDRVLTAGFGVGFWGGVDQAFENLAPDAVWPGVTGPVLGGHARVLVGYRTDGVYRELNSWGTSWSSGGFGLLARSVVASGSVGLVGILSGPVL